MPEIYKNGKKYGGPAYPLGGTTGQLLAKKTNAQDDVEWVDATSGFIFSYIVGSTPFAGDWLSDSPSGTAIIPDADALYLILTVGSYYHNFLRWDATATEYVVIGASLVEGYYKEADGKFYEESTYTTEIVGVEDSLYVSVDTNKPYWFDGINFNAFTAAISDEDMSAIENEIDAVDLSVPSLVEYTEDELYSLIWEDLDIDGKPEYTEADLDAILDQIDFSGGGGGGVEMSAAEMLAIWNTVFGS